MSWVVRFFRNQNATKLLVVCAALVLEAALVQAQTPAWKIGFQSITAEELYENTAVLADDSMRGRDTPSPELEKAAAFIAERFRACGLAFAPGLNSYYQPFQVLRTRLSSPNRLRLRLPDTTIICELKHDFVPLQLTASGQVRAPVVFVGYGITAPEFGYDDYADIDVTGKIVLMFTHEPRERDSTDVFLGPKATEHSKLLTKTLTALDHGAVGMILVNDPLNHFARRPPNPWPSLMRRKLKNTRPPLRLAESQESIVGVHISKRLGQLLLSSAGYDLRRIQQQIDSTLTPRSVPLPVEATLEVNVHADTFVVNNVLGYLRGRDPAVAGEVLVIGAHYDHVGTVDTVIYNGADDNASGTSGVLELAEAFTLNPVRPRRSILFACFAGEEKGLYGSRSYVRHPPVPLDSTVAMLNLDMTSRNDSNQVSVAGSSVSPDLFCWTQDLNRRYVGLEITTEADKSFRQSDHYSFYRKNIPVLFFNTLEHPDLHKPTDDVDKIIPQKMEKITRLVFLVAWRAANAAKRPRFHPFESPRPTCPKSDTSTSQNEGGTEK